jgi:hypothetical protein
VMDRHWRSKSSTSSGMGSRVREASVFRGVIRPSTKPRRNETTPSPKSTSCHLRPNASLMRGPNHLAKATANHSLSPNFARREKNPVAVSCIGCFERLVEPRGSSTRSFWHYYVSIASLAVLATVFAFVLLMDVWLAVTILFHEVTPEATPMGAWTVHLVKALPGLRHSTHSNIEAITIIRDWLRICAQNTRGAECTSRATIGSLSLRR